VQPIKVYSAKEQALRVIISSILSQRHALAPLGQAAGPKALYGQVGLKVPQGQEGVEIYMQLPTSRAKVSFSGLEEKQWLVVLRACTKEELRGSG